MGRKCAVVKCRSGYDLTAEEKKVASGCDKKSVFRFPADKELRARWLKVKPLIENQLRKSKSTSCSSYCFQAISREEGFANLDHVGVCQLHFKPENLNTTSDTTHGRKRSRTTLKANAVPTIFKEYPK